MPWFPTVAEQSHELQNPTSAEKIRLLGERLGLGARSLVLDVASGRGGPALVLAEEYGCRVVCVERAEEFHAAAVERTRARGLSAFLELHLADAAEFELEPERYDVALCLGASFVWGGLEPTLAALLPCVRPGGHVAVGEPYWRSQPPADEDEGYVSLAETVERFERSGLPVVAVVAASDDDWDRYETLHWQTVEEWLVEHADDPEAASVRDQHERWKARYLAFGRKRLGWAILAGWKRPS